MDTATKRGYIFKAVLLIIVVAAGICAVLTAPQAVSEVLPCVTLTCVSEASYSETVNGSGIITAAADGSYALLAAVNEGDIAKVKIGQSAELRGAAFENGRYYGTVADISPVARQQQCGLVTETVVDVTLSVDNPDSALRSGYTAQAVIAVTNERVIRVLPYECIMQDDAGEYCYVYEGGRTVRRSIETGAELPDGAEILGGIDEHDEVVSAPQDIGENVLAVRSAE